jgi:hypothetical protein
MRPLRYKSIVHARKLHGARGRDQNQRWNANQHVDPLTDGKLEVCWSKSRPAHGRQILPMRSISQFRPGRADRISAKYGPDDRGRRWWLYRLCGARVPRPPPECGHESGSRGCLRCGIRTAERWQPAQDHIRRLLRGFARLAAVEQVRLARHAGSSLPVVDRTVLSLKLLAKRQRRQVIDVAALLLVAGARNHLNLLFDALGLRTEPRFCRGHISTELQN